MDNREARKMLAEIVNEPAHLIWVDTVTSLERLNRTCKLLTGVHMAPVNGHWVLDFHCSEWEVGTHLRFIKRGDSVDYYPGDIIRVYVGAHDNEMSGLVLSIELL